MEPEDLELAALSTLRTPQDVLAAAEAGVENASFQVAAHAAAWEYLREQAAAGKSVTPADVRLVCGVDLVEGLSDRDSVVDAMVERAVSHRAVSAIYGQRDALVSNPREAVRSLIGELGTIAQGASGGHQVRFDQGLRDRLARLTDRAAAVERGDLVGIPTGLPLLDNLGDTWKPGELVSVIGATNAGKSFFTLWLASVGYLAGHSVLFLSPESTIEDVEHRLDPILAHALGHEVSNRGLRNGTQDPKAYQAYMTALALRKVPAWTTRDTGDAGVFTVRDIVEEARRVRPGILVIDGFHLIRGEGKSWESMQEAAKAVKGVAQELGCVVFAVSQAQRSATLATDDAPELGHAAYGLALMEASNRVISLAEKRGDTKQRVFKIPKNRDGERYTKRQYLRFDVDRGDVGQLVAEEHDDGMVDF